MINILTLSSLCDLRVLVQRCIAPLVPLSPDVVIPPLPLSPQELQLADADIARLEARVATLLVTLSQMKAAARAAKRAQSSLHTKHGGYAH